MSLLFERKFNATLLSRFLFFNLAAYHHGKAASKAIFALGIIGTELLAIPVLAGASGYTLSDAFGWK
jgi:hypothetical protein